jgi:hypothetical protein
MAQLLDIESVIPLTDWRTNQSGDVVSWSKVAMQRVPPPATHMASIRQHPTTTTAHVVRRQ